MPYRLDHQLVIGVSSRALFQLEEADGVFRRDGLAAYRAFQRQHENDPLLPGTAFRLIRGLLAINIGRPTRLVEVVVISRNDPDTGIRIFNSIEHHGLDISRGAFTDGRDANPYLKPFSCNLFLSADPADVVAGLRFGVPAALVMPPPVAPVLREEDPEVRIAFDGDAVLFDEESERIYQEQGLEAFLANEKALADVPMNPGPFEPFLRALQRVQSEFQADESPIRVALVTARNAPAHKRVINTLRAWDVRVDEAFFLGGVDKGPILSALRPHIYFDDHLSHLESAQAETPSARVPSGDMEMTLFDDVAVPEAAPTALVTMPAGVSNARPVRPPDVLRSRGALALNLLDGSNGTEPLQVAHETPPDQSSGTDQRPDGNHGPHPRNSARRPHRT